MEWSSSSSSSSSNIKLVSSECLLLEEKTSYLSWKCIKFDTWLFVWQFKQENFANFFVKILIQKLICQIWCITKTKWLVYFSLKRRRSEAKVWKPQQLYYYIDNLARLNDTTWLWQSIYDKCMRTAELFTFYLIIIIKKLWIFKKISRLI